MSHGHISSLIAECRFSIFIKINGCHSNKILCFLSKIEFPTILVARQWTLHALYILFISLLQYIANTLFDTIGEIKRPLLYCFRFEMILNSWLLCQKCCQREHSSLRDSLWFPSNNTVKVIRRQLLYATKSEGSFYMCIKFPSKCQPSSKILTNSQLFLIDSHNNSFFFY